MPSKEHKFSTVIRDENPRLGAEFGLTGGF